MLKLIINVSVVDLHESKNKKINATDFFTPEHQFLILGALQGFYSDHCIGWKPISLNL